MSRHGLSQNLLRPFEGHNSCVFSGCHVHRISDDIGVNITRLQLLSDAHVRNFVPRLGENKGLLPVRLRLSGPDNIPAAAFIQVRKSMCFRMKSQLLGGQHVGCMCRMHGTCELCKFSLAG